MLLRRAGLVEPDAPLEAASPVYRALAGELSETLGGLALALDQAGAYIEETQCSLVEYQRQYQEQGIALLGRRSDLKDDHPEAVATTWSLSFARVEAAHPAAAEVLRVCAFLAPDAIPEELLVEVLKKPLPTSVAAPQQRKRQNRAKQPPSEIGKKQGPAAAAKPQADINEAIATLRAYSLIQRNAENKTLRVHRLVQAVIRETMSHQELVQLIAQVSSLLDQAFPSSGAFGQWDACARYLPQMLVFLSHLKASEITTSETADVLRRAGWYLGARGQLHEAEELLTYALFLQEQSTSGNEIALARAALALGWLYVRQGKCAEAEPL